MILIINLLQKLQCIWDKVTKNGPGEICGRQPLKKLNAYDLLKAIFHIFQLVYFRILCPIWFIQYCQMKNHVNIEMQIDLFFINNVRWYTHLYTSLFPSVCMSVCLFVGPSGAHHISGTVYHMIIIFGARVQKDDISRIFFTF